MALIGIGVKFNGADAIKSIKQFANGATKVLSKIKRGAVAVGSSLSKMGNSVSNMGAALSGLAIGSFVKESIAAFDAQEKAVASVRNGLELTGTASGKTLDGLISQASELQKNSLFGDEQILNDVTAQFLTFGNITGEAFDRAQEAAINLSAKIGNDLKGQAIQLGKALDNPTQGVSALAEAGVTFTKSQKEQIKVLQESGDVLGAQSLILTEIEAKYGGAAAAAAAAGSGPLTQLQMRFADIQEIIGQALIPGLTKLSNILGTVASWIENNKELFMDMVKVIGITVGILGTLIVAMKIANLVMAANPIVFLVTYIALMIALIVVLVKKIVVLVKKYEGWGKSFKVVSEIIKSHWTGFIDSIKTGFTVFKFNIQIMLEKFKNFGTALKNMFAGIGTAITKFLSGDFSGGKDAFKNAFNDAFTIENKTLDKLKGDLHQVQKAFGNRKLQRELGRYQESKKIGLTKVVDEKDAVKKGGSIIPKDPGGGNGASASTTASKSGLKQISVNIENVVREMEINQDQDPLILKDKIMRVLTTYLANVSNYA